MNVKCMGTTEAPCGWILGASQIRQNYLGSKIVMGIVGHIKRNIYFLFIVSSWLNLLFHYRIIALDKT